MERNRIKLFGRTLALLLCTVMLTASWFPACAQGTEPPAATPTATQSAADGGESTGTAKAASTEAPRAEGESESNPEPDYGIIDDAELTKMVENFLGERGISSKNFSLGFYYTGTGDTWYYNPDKWFYPASVYKVPLMMLLSEQVQSGAISQSTQIEGLEVSTIEEYILVHSNNDWAHTIRKYLGGDEVWRQDAKKYSSLADSEYDPDYMDYCYFSNRYITEVMKTLYNEPERFPNIMEMLLQAEPTHYFRLAMEGKYKIAQKYGSFCDKMGDNFNHTTGVIYTQNPIIVTVMTLNVGDYEKVISDAAVMMKDYALSLDNRLSGYKRELEKAEADRLAAEQAEAEAKAQAEAEAKRQAEEQAAAQKAIAEQQALQEARKELFTKLGILVAVLAVLAAAYFFIVRSRQQKKREERYESYRRRYEAEQRRSDANSRSRSGKGGSGGNGYRPRH